MCVICVSKRGVRQPSIDELRNMFTTNPDGAGYMFRDKHGKVVISKGYMDIDSFLHAVQYEHFTDDTPVVYHFRISTQAGVCPEMTQPFAYGYGAARLASTRLLDLKCSLGVAHNGIISMTTDHSDKLYSDTAHFVVEYLPYLVRNKHDLKDARVLNMIKELINGSRLAFLDDDGNVTMIGNFSEDADSGLYFSNMYWKPRTNKAASLTDWRERFSSYKYPIGFDETPPHHSKK